MTEHWDYTPSGSPRVVFECNGRRTSVVRYCYRRSGSSVLVRFRVFPEHREGGAAPSSLSHDVIDHREALEMARKLVML